MDRAARHLELLTATTAAVTSTLDLARVLEEVAARVAEAMGTDACFVYLYDEASGMLELRATHGTRFDDPAHRPRMRLGEGITGAAAAERAPITLAREAHLDPRFIAFPNLPEEEYESILAVPVLARDVLEGALNVRTRAPRVFAEDEIALLEAIAAQVGQAIENARLYERSRARILELEAIAEISAGVTQSLYLDEALEAVARSTARALAADECAVVVAGEDGDRVGYRSADVVPEARLLELAAAAPLVSDVAAAEPLVWKRRRRGALVVLSARPRAWTPEERSLLSTVAHQAAAAVENARAVMRGLLAQEIHHRVKNNLQTVASLLRLELGAGDATPAAEKALRDSVNRILSIAAVHDLLTEAREDDVDCADLVGRLQRMLAHELGGRPVTATLAPVALPGQRATALALVFCELFANAVEHGSGPVAIELRRSGETARLEVRDAGSGPPAAQRDGLGLTIARSLAREQLGGRLELAGAGEGRAVVTFPAGS